MVFFQGCPMRCLYCHNPDTWDIADGQEYTAEQILNQMERNRAFYQSGGLTVTGGEPMVQIDFLTELFQEAHSRNIHTCVDTSGVLFDSDNSVMMEKVEKLMQYTDLVMLDIKHMEEKEHKDLTGHSNEKILAFAKYLCEKKKPVWIRHVVVPGITFVEEELTALGQFLRTLPNVEKLEVLPYHSMGKVKYDNLGMEYALKDVPQLTKEEAREAEVIIRRAWDKE